MVQMTAVGAQAATPLKKEQQVPPDLIDRFLKALQDGAVTYKGTIANTGKMPPSMRCDITKVKASFTNGEFVINTYDNNNYIPQNYSWDPSTNEFFFGAQHEIENSENALVYELNPKDLPSALYCSSPDYLYSIEIWTSPQRAYEAFVRFIAAARLGLIKGGDKPEEEFRNLEAVCGQEGLRSVERVYEELKNLEQEINHDGNGLTREKVLAWISAEYKPQDGAPRTHLQDIENWIGKKKTELFYNKIVKLPPQTPLDKAYPY
jgi:hypothetical protein